MVILLLIGFALLALTCAAIGAVLVIKNFMDDSFRWGGRDGKGK